MNYNVLSIYPFYQANIKINLYFAILYTGDAFPILSQIQPNNDTFCWQYAYVLDGREAGSCEEHGGHEEKYGWLGRVWSDQ